jgi:membrane protein YdbS with pleckstrin-like domain
VCSSDGVGQLFFPEGEKEYNTIGFSADPRSIEMTDKYILNMLGDNERILLATRQHWFVLFSSLLLEVVVTVGVIVAISVATINFPPAAIAFVLVFLPLLSMLHDILVWKNRQYLVTTRRVIQIAGIFNKSVTDSSLEKVNDVKMVQSFLGRMFGFGDVEILTGSELGVNLFKRIGDPVNFKTAMLNAKEKLGYEGLSHGSHGDDIPSQIAELDELRKKGVITELEFQTKKTELLSKM